MGGIWYAIVRYQFLKISPRVVSECIVASIDESFLLLDNDFTIVRVNRATEELLGVRPEIPHEPALPRNHAESDGIAHELDRMRDGAFDSLSCRPALRAEKGSPV